MTADQTQPDVPAPEVMDAAEAAFWKAVEGQEVYTVPWVPFTAAIIAALAKQRELDAAAPAKPSPFTRCECRRHTPQEPS